MAPISFKPLTDPTFWGQDVGNPENSQAINDILNTTDDANTASLILRTPYLCSLVMQPYTTPTTSYDNFTPSSLTADMISNDKIFNQAIYSYVTGANRYDPSLYPNWSAATDYFSSYWVNTLLNSTLYSVPWYDMLFDLTYTYNAVGHLAVRYHMFDSQPDTIPVLSIVDVDTGEEKFRIPRDADANITNVRKVINGVMQNDVELSFSEMMQIANVIPTAITGYAPLDTMYNAIQLLVDQQKDPSGEQSYVNNFITQSEATPFVNGTNGNIVFGTITDAVYNPSGVSNGKLVVDYQEYDAFPRLIAVDRPSENNQYLFGKTWLPWNNPKYIIYDNYKNSFVGVNPLSTDNFLTILKLIGLGLVFYEIITVLLSGKLFKIDLTLLNKYF